MKVRKENKRRRGKSNQSGDRRQRFIFLDGTREHAGQTDRHCNDPSQRFERAKKMRARNPINTPINVSEMNSPVNAAGAIPDKCFSISLDNMGVSASVTIER